MKLVRRKNYYNPFYELERIQDEINNIFDGTFGFQQANSSGILETSWAPSVDVYDSKDNVLVKADIPGLKKEDINITVQDNTLIIEGQKNRNDEINEDNYVRVERFYGNFYRAILLPSEIDSSNVKAEYKNGTLELILPKKEEAKPKQIKVEIK